MHDRSPEQTSSTVTRRSIQNGRSGCQRSWQYFAPSPVAIQHLNAARFLCHSWRGVEQSDMALALLATHTMTQIHDMRRCFTYIMRRLSAHERSLALPLLALLLIPCVAAAADPQLQDAVGRRARQNLEQARNVLTGVRRCPRNDPHRDRRHASGGSSKHTVASYMRCRDLGEANKSATALLALRDSQLEATRCPATNRQDWIFGRINSWAVRHHHSHV